MTFSLLPSSLSAVSSRRALAAVLLLSAALTGCSSLTSGEGGKRESLEQKAIREGAREDVEADRREQLAEMLRQDPGASLSDLPHARLAAQTNHACLAAIETMAERYSGRRVMLGEAARRPDPGRPARQTPAFHHAAALRTARLHGCGAGAVLRRAARSCRADPARVPLPAAFPEVILE